MATTKYHGKNTVFLWRETGGSLVDLSGSSRNVSIEEQGQKIDTSTRDDLVANQRSSLADTPERSASLSGLDTTPLASRTWHAIDIGDEGIIAVYPTGTGTGNPYDLATAQVRSSRYESPHDGPATWQLEWDLTTAITKGTTA